MALPSVSGPGIDCLGLGLGLGLRKRMSSIVFLVLGRKGSSICGGAGRGGSVMASVSTGGTDSLIVAAEWLETALVLGLSTIVARECWDNSELIRVMGE